MKKQNENSFESMLARIDEITAKLESPETTVDEGIMLFEEGVKLSSLCKIFVAIQLAADIRVAYLYT